MTEFTVEGMPETKGSWKVAGRKRNGAPRMVADNPAESAWAASVAWAAKAALAGRAADREPYAVLLDFTLRPPHGKKNRRDLDKLARSVLDAMTGIVWLDDEQVVRMYLDKHVAAGRALPGVRIQFERLPPTPLTMLDLLV